MIEEWKTIKNYPNYKISNLGNVINAKKQQLPKRDNGYGYLIVNLYENSKRKKMYIHRLVALHFVPNPYNKQEVNHIDGNKQNNNVNNLEWVTRSENSKHSWLLGLSKSTQKHKEAARNNLKNMSIEKRILGRENLIRKNKCKKINSFIWENRKNCIPLYCMELHKVFFCASRVEEILGIKQNTILCNIERGYKTCGGYHWKKLKKRY